VEFVIRFRGENAPEVTSADILITWMVQELPTLVVHANPTYALLSRRANAIVERIADSHTNLTTLGVVETVLLAAITEPLLPAMPSKRASVREALLADSVTKLEITKTVQMPSLTSTASLVFAMLLKEVNVIVVIVAALTMVVLTTVVTESPKVCAMLTNVVNVREANLAATLTMLLLLKHKTISTHTQYIG